MLLRKLTLPMLGADDETDPPWDHLSTLFSIVPHLIAAVAILSAAILPYLEGQTTKVALVTLLIAMQVGLRGMGDYAYRHRSPADGVKPWFDRFVYLSLFSGLAWGSALAILYAGGSPDTQVVVLAVVCGIVQSSAARAYLAPRSTLLVIVIVTAFVNVAAIREGNWIMVPICIAYVGFLASYMMRLIAMDESRVEAERKTRVLVEALAESNAKLTQANEQLRRHARTDALTGLQNRRGFDEALQRRMSVMRTVGTPFALLLIDVDHFKRFNDAHGHPAGDECLRIVGERLNAEVMETGGIAARYGGEEFAILLQGDQARQAAAFADALRLAIGRLKMPTTDGISATLTVSIGVATADPADDERALIARADRRLYAAKAAGRDRICASDRPDRRIGSA